MSTKEKAEAPEVTTHADARGSIRVNVPNPLVRQFVNVPSTHAALAAHVKAEKHGDVEPVEPQFVEGFDPAHDSASVEAPQSESDAGTQAQRHATKRGARK